MCLHVWPRAAPADACLQEKVRRNSSKVDPDRVQLLAASSLKRYVSIRCIKNTEHPSNPVGPMI